MIQKIIMLNSSGSSKLDIRIDSNTPLTPVGNLAILLFIDDDFDQHWQYKHLYLVEDRSIEIGDFGICVKNDKFSNVHRHTSKNFLEPGKENFKILATTDPDLTSMGVTLLTNVEIKSFVDGYNFSKLNS